MKRVCMFSGGVSSWAAAKREAERNGVEGLTLLFADTKEEDDLSDISFSLPPTPDWQLKIDAFFFTPSESRRI